MQGIPGILRKTLKGSRTHQKNSELHSTRRSETFFMRGSEDIKHNKGYELGEKACLLLLVLKNCRDSAGKCSLSCILWQLLVKFGTFAVFSSKHYVSHAPEMRLQASWPSVVIFNPYLNEILGKIKILFLPIRVSFSLCFPFPGKRLRPLLTIQI